MGTGRIKRAAEPDENQRRRQTATSEPCPAEPSPAERIWLVLAQIPRGRVTSYGVVARLAGMPRHARLVGRTLASLPSSSQLPWHRVVNASRRLATRADPTAVERQRARLTAEGVEFVGDRVVADHFWAG